ncbi:hypothetical protein TNCV_2268011 [Trichonephila clavipes]|nr:hypothetical protein TNCV_2268011 [Trichonephila clavipes]
MKDTVFEIKMAQHRPIKPASVEYTTDEEDTIVYDMGEEIESPKMAVLKRSPSFENYKLENTGMKKSGLEKSSSEDLAPPPAVSQ